MSATQLSIEFGNFLRSSKMEMADAFKEFAAENDLSLHDIAVLVAERPGLGRLKFINVAEVVLLQVQGGRPEVYTQFYEHMRWMVDAIQATNTEIKFAEVYRMACIRAREAKVEKIPAYPTDYQYVKKIYPDYFKKNEDNV